MTTRLTLRFLYPAFIVGLLVTLLGISAVRADVIDEGEFWSRLQQTNMQLQLAISDTSRQSSLISDVRDQWNNVDTVRLTDGSTFAVDLRWLTRVNATSLKATQRQVQALLDYHDSAAGRRGNLRSALAALNQVLSDPRFQYPDVTPTLIPSPTPEPQTPDTGRALFSAELGQALLLIMAVVAVVGVLAAIGRGLQLRRVELPAVDSPDDPTSSREAINMAAESEAERDYRNAIRYLYLSSLLLLDERGLIHYDRTLTNREHLRQIAGNQTLSEALKPVVNTFDSVWYGFAPVDEAMYAEFRQNVETLHRITP